MTTRIAATPLSWHGEGEPWNTVLDQISGLGFSWMELGPIRLLPEDSRTLASALRDRGLRLVGATRFLAFRYAAKKQEVLDIVHRTSRLLRDLRATHLIVIDRPDGSTGPGGNPVAVKMTEEQWGDTVASIRTIVDVARTEYELKVALHPHFGSCVFMAEQIDRLMHELEDVDLEICVDTGHALWGGMDPATLVERYRPRVAAIHLRDVQSLDSTEACGLGEGIFDPSMLIHTLDASDFGGWVTVDQDPIHGRPALSVAASNVAYLDALGLKLG